jgi:hypothetical protein
VSTQKCDGIDATGLNVLCGSQCFSLSSKPKIICYQRLKLPWPTQCCRAVDSIRRCLFVCLVAPSTNRTMTDSRRVSYFYDAEVGNYHYGQGTDLKKDEKAPDTVCVQV